MDTLMELSLVMLDQEFCPECGGALVHGEFDCAPNCQRDAAYGRIKALRQWMAEKKAAGMCFDDMTINLHQSPYRDESCIGQRNLQLAVDDAHLLGLKHEGLLVRLWETA